MTQYDDDNETGLVADLRKQLREKDKELNELQSKFGEVAKRDRERTLKDVFTEKGVKPAVMKFFPADAEVSEESVNAWLSENADLFGIELKPDGEAPPANDAPVPDAWARLNALQSPSVSTGNAADLIHQINNASEADLIALIQTHGGGSAS